MHNFLKLSGDELNEGESMAFSQKRIYLVIALTTISLIGILLVQYFWIDAAYNTQQEQFDQRFNDLRGEINNSLRADMQLQNSMLAYTNSSIYPSLRSFIYQIPLPLPFAIANKDLPNSNALLPKSTLKSKINHKIDSVFAANNFDISYEFSLISRNNACNQCGEEEQRDIILSSVSDVNPASFLETKYKTGGNALLGFGYLNINFPGKEFFIAKQIGWMLALSILGILIIGGCFGYTILTIRRQKKLAEMKNDFINNMTHELKTPIFSISLASKALRKAQGIPESPKVQKYLDLIDDENKRLKNQVNKVLQMALMDAEESRLNKQEVNIHQLIRDVADSFKLKMKEHNGSIALQLNADKQLIKADETHLSNILHSLIDNAIKYSDEQPDITITTRDRDEGVCFSIADRGVGMDEETQKHIFDKFYRAQSGDQYDVKGFGLGLSYVKSIVEAHQGWITLKSKINKGSRFTIYLPA